ncbi:hypothetical protein KY346_01925 [Candidatus Woesearchaeota archaeon]|nr:hypothetical protein [Candidatus Woesearchaeota archaeon]
MKTFITKNLPFLSILIIAALLFLPFIIADEMPNVGDVDLMPNIGDVNVMPNLGDANMMPNLGDVDQMPNLGDADSMPNEGDGGGIGEDKETIDEDDEEEEDEKDDDKNDSPFDSTPDPEIPPTDEIPPLDEVFQATIDISISDSPDPVEPGDELVYTINYYNEGTGTASDVIITFDADSDAQIDSSEPDATTGNYRWRIEEVPARTGDTIVIRTTVDDDAKDGQTITGVVSISYHDPIHGEKATSETAYTTVRLDAAQDDDEDEAPIETIGIKVLSTRFPMQTVSGEPLFLTIGIENDGTESLEDVKIAVVSQELGMRASAGPFDLSRGDDVTKTLLFDIPYGTPEGNYFLRFTITSNGQTRRVVYRDIDIVPTLE